MEKNTYKSFENWLEERFIELDVYGETPITKDNCDDLFENWLENDLDMNEIIQWAELWGQQMYLNASQRAFEKAQEIINKPVEK